MLPCNVSAFQTGIPSWPPSYNSNPTMSVSMPVSPKPQWFISRGAGVYTALIPADELPHSVNLKGVSSTMTVDQVVGMTLVAETGPSRQRFLLDGQSFSVGQGRVDSAFPSPIALPSKHFFAPDAHFGHAESPQSVAAAGVEEKAEVEEPKIVVNIPTRPDAAAAVKVDSYYPRQRPLPPSGHEPDETKKVFCSYWIHHGSCDYTQQGCKYKHEMPTDRATLTSLGFRAIPKWYLEEQAARRAHVGATTSQDARVSPPPVRLPVRPSQATAAESGAAENKASVREEPNVKRYRFTDASPVKVEKAATKIAPAPCAKLAPPVIFSTPKTELSAPKTIPSKSTLAVVTVEATLPKPESLNLIDLSDSEEEQHCPTIRPSSSTPTAAASPRSVSPSSPPSLSASSSDSETAVEPKTPPTSATAIDTPTKEKGVFIPTGESPQYHLERARTKQQRFPKKSGHKHDLKTATVHGKKADAATAASEPPKAVPVAEKIDVAGPSTCEFVATRLNASVYATPSPKVVKDEN